VRVRRGGSSTKCEHINQQKTDIGNSLRVETSETVLSEGHSGFLSRRVHALLCHCRSSLDAEGNTIRRMKSTILTKVSTIRPFGSLNYIISPSSTSIVKEFHSSDTIANSE